MNYLPNYSPPVIKTSPIMAEFACNIKTVSENYSSVPDDFNENKSYIIYLNLPTIRGKARRRSLKKYLKLVIDSKKKFTK